MRKLDIKARNGKDMSIYFNYYFYTHHPHFGVGTRMYVLAVVIVSLFVILNLCNIILQLHQSMEELKEENQNLSLLAGQAEYLASVLNVSVQ